jgi:hypothetical protein
MTHPTPLECDFPQDDVDVLLASFPDCDPDFNPHFQTSVFANLLPIIA